MSSLVIVESALSNVAITLFRCLVMASCTYTINSSTFDTSTIADVYFRNVKEGDEIPLLPATGWYMVGEERSQICEGEREP